MNKYSDVEKEAILNSLKEEYNLIQSKKNILKEHNEIIKEYLFYLIYLEYLCVLKIDLRLIL